MTLRPVAAVAAVGEVRADQHVVLRPGRRQGEGGSGSGQRRELTQNLGRHYLNPRTSWAKI